MQDTVAIRSREPRTIAAYQRPPARTYKLPEQVKKDLRLEDREVRRNDLPRPSLSLSSGLYEQWLFNILVDGPDIINRQDAVAFLQDRGDLTATYYRAVDDLRNLDFDFSGKIELTQRSFSKIRSLLTAARRIYEMAAELPSETLPQNLQRIMTTFRACAEPVEGLRLLELFKLLNIDGIAMAYDLGAHKLTVKAFLETPDGETSAMDVPPDIYMPKDTRCSWSSSANDPLQLSLKNIIDRAYGIVVDKFQQGNYDEEISLLVDAFAELDIYMAFAAFAKVEKSDSPKSRPEIVDDVSLPLEIKEAWSPTVAREIQEAMVRNDVLLHNVEGDRRLVEITSGPNMTGKSSRLFSIAAALHLAQIGSWIPAAYARICPADAMFTHISLAENHKLKLSLFGVEITNLSETIMAKGVARGIAFLDEICSSTIAGPGAAIAQAVLEKLSGMGIRIMATTHLEDLLSLGDEPPAFNTHMEFSHDLTTGQIVDITYRVRSGPSPKYDPIDTAATLGLPDDVVARARELLAEKTTST